MYQVSDTNCNIDKSRDRDDRPCTKNEPGIYLNSLWWLVVYIFDVYISFSVSLKVLFLIFIWMTHSAKYRTSPWWKLIYFFLYFSRIFKLDWKFTDSKQNRPTTEKTLKTKNSDKIFQCDFILGFTVITKLCTSSILDFVNTKHPDYHSCKI